MDFRIADTFTASLARLTGDEQKAVKTTAFDLQVNPAAPGMQFHKLEKAKDKCFWSVRVSSDIRLIVHRTQGSLLLCYADHHDAAYDWAERRRLETHPKTGAAQWVEIRERVQEVVLPKYVEAPAAPKRALFADTPTDDLFACGVPAEWLDEVRRATEDDLLDLADHLPAEAAEALLVLATGGTVARLAQRADEEARAREEFADQDALVLEEERTEVLEADLHSPGADAFEHPDARRRFRTVASAAELERALEYPWDKWTVFLHPAQRESVERRYGGPARVAGSAGTGKTIVALHRAVHLARAHPDARVLLTTFSEPLANALRTRLRRLIGNEPLIGERLEVHSLDGIARRLYELNLGRPTLASADTVRSLLQTAAREAGLARFSAHFLETEWRDVVDAWQLTGWEAYRDVARLGRKTRLREAQRRSLWDVFERVRDGLAGQGLLTPSDMLERLMSHLAAASQRPFQFVVVDEAQDLSVAQLRFLAALAGGAGDSLFFAGDLGQRIFQQPFSWKALGVDVRGRSRTLRVNYRTSHQIRSQADRLLGGEVADVDGNKEVRRGTVSVLNGPEPSVEVLATPDDECAFVAAWLRDRVTEGVAPHEAAVFVRSLAQIDRARAAVQAAGVPLRVLDDRVETASGHVSVSTMHIAKGLEFRAAVVMACDDGVIPLQERIESVADDADLEDVYETERHLLYVACTRARDFLLVTAVEPVSEFLDDLRG